jgi:hypothetical protein
MKRLKVPERPGSVKVPVYLLQGSAYKSRVKVYKCDLEAETKQQD